MYTVLPSALFLSLPLTSSATSSLLPRKNSLNPPLIVRQYCSSRAICMADEVFQNVLALAGITPLYVTDLP